MKSFSEYLKEEQNKKEDGSENHGVLAYARMNPPHKGHEEVVNTIHSVANKHNASHQLVLSRSQDKKKNPLSPEDKLKHVQRAFPETNTKLASKEAPTILHHAAEMYKKGVRHLHIVAGSDRHKEFSDVLNKYNDGKKYPHGSFKFKSITMHSSGERDEDAKGVSGLSATKVRELASSGKKKQFHSALPSKMKPEHKEELYNDLRKAMN